jgi:septum formation protein
MPQSDPRAAVWPKMGEMPLILASQSPRRADLLTAAGIPFALASADVDETPLPDEVPVDYVLRVAKEKAILAAAPEADSRAVLAADTVVVAGGRLLGKPATAGESREMLQLLSGRVHEVHTGVVLRAGKREFSEVVTTRVRFVTLTDDEIQWYIATGEPEGKAGGYAIQGRASRFVDWIEGSWSNVVGLPVATVYRMLTAAGVLS